MRNLLRVATVALLITTWIAITGGPANAEASEWGYLDPPTVAHPGTRIRAGIAPITRWDAFRRLETGAFDALVRATDACDASPIHSLEAFDAFGRVWSAPDLSPDVSRSYINLSPSAPTGTYWLRVQCMQGETTPELVAVCLRFEIDPARPAAGGSVLADVSRPLVSNRCPAQSLGRILTGVPFETLRAAVGLLADSIVGNGFGGVAPSTSSTTRPAGSPGGGTGIPNGNGGGTPGESDTSPPKVSNVEAHLEKCNVLVSASVDDNIGVGSVDASWNGSPGSGNQPMSGGGESWSTTISANALTGGKGTLTVVVTARDAAGNKASGVAYVDFDPALC